MSQLGRSLALSLSVPSWVLRVCVANAFGLGHVTLSNCSRLVAFIKSWLIYSSHVVDLWGTIMKGDKALSVL